MNPCCTDLTEDEKQFVKFIESFSDWFKPACDISDSILPTDKGRNKFKLFSLDEICQSFEMSEGGFGYTPKTTDAIWYRKRKDGRFTIFLIEFKGDLMTNYSTKLRLCNYIQDLIEKRDKAYSDFEKRELNNDIEKLKKILMKYSDKMLNDLILKPLETVTVSIPLIYELYYNENKDKEDIKHLDIMDFLRKSRIIYKVVCYEDKNGVNPNRQHAIARRNGNYRNDLKKLGCKKFLEKQSDIELTNELTENYENNLNSFYIRYTEANIINTEKFDYFISNREFNNFFKKICKEIT